LVVTDKDGKIVPPDSIQAAFFIVLVDLWNEDGTEAKNRVRVPLANTVTNKRQKHGHSRSDSLPQSLQRTPSVGFGPENPAASTSYGGENGSQFQSGRMSPLSSPIRSSANGSPVVKRKRPRRATDGLDGTMEAEPPRSSIEADMATTQTFYVSAPDPSTSQYYVTTPYTTDLMGYHTFYAPSYATTTNTGAAAGPAPSGPEYGTVSLQAPGDQVTTSMTGPSGVSYGPGAPLMGHAFANGIPQPPPQAQPQPPTPIQPYQWMSTSAPPTTVAMTGPALTTVPTPEEPAEYARTLIGPLAASAQTLTDDHEEPGIFFLFQDLSVRTEGTFRLRMRLVNVGGPPAPEPGASHVRHDNSTVLAQVFTNPFIVFSAKKFPGVPSPTALSQRLLQQGLKIPGRARPNPKVPTSSRKTKRKKTGGEDWGLGSGSGAASNGSDEE
ncbi:hypothetical protein FRC17_005813, partial [Serendipita sp. 399]